MTPRPGSGVARPVPVLAFNLGLFAILPAIGGLILLACTAGDGGSSGQSDPPGELSEPPGLVAGASASSAFPLEIQDAAGELLVFQTPPNRIISLVPSASEALQALGAQELLVGRTQYDTGSALAHLPSVGGGLAPSLESLVALEPDLVIRFAGGSDPATASRLDDLGIRHLAIRLDRIEDVRSLMRDLGAVTDKGDRAEEVVAKMDATLLEIHERVRGRPRVRVAYLLGGNPPWVAGPGTFIDELLTIAGGENSFSDQELLYGPVSPEQFLVRDLDLLIAPEGVEVVLPSTEVPLVRVSSALELPGPNLDRAAWQLAKILHPEAFQ